MEKYFVEKYFMEKYFVEKLLVEKFLVENKEKEIKYHLHCQNGFLKAPLV